MFQKHIHEVAGFDWSELDAKPNQVYVSSKMLDAKPNSTLVPAVNL